MGVLHEKESEIVAQFKFTVLLMPNGPHKITWVPFDPSKCTSTHSIEDTWVLTLLKTSANPKSGKNKKKAAEKAVASETAKAASDDAPPKLTPAAAANES